MASPLQELGLSVMLVIDLFNIFSWFLISYNEQMFQGLDFVVSEAKKYGIKLVLSLVNNYEDFGGKKQYVEWAKNKGESISSEDDFFTNSVVKGFYKNHIKDWITEMAPYLKSIDANHLLEIGLEGFCGDDRKQYNTNNIQAGTNFITNNQVPSIDFATVHCYPDQWLSGSTGAAQLFFLSQWVQQHILDSLNILKKLIVFAEFGKSYKVAGYTSSDRNQLYNITYSSIYTSACEGGPATGGLFWQLLANGMDNFRDGYEIVLGDEPNITGIISGQSKKLSRLKKARN